MKSSTLSDSTPHGDRPVRVVPVEDRRVEEIAVQIAPVRFVVVGPASFLVH